MFDLYVDGDEQDLVFDPSDGETRVQVSNPAAENGYDQPAGPLTWVNSATITLDPSDDAVHVSVSVGDPRGAFVMTLRRLPDGRIVLHHPYAGESMPHVETTEIHKGTLQLKGNYADPESEDEDED